MTVPLPLANFGHTIVALETNLCHVFCFPESEKCITFITKKKPLYGGLVVKVSDGLYTLLIIHEHPVFGSVGMTF